MFCTSKEQPNVFIAVENLQTRLSTIVDNSEKGNQNRLMQCVWGTLTTEKAQPVLFIEYPNRDAPHGWIYESDCETFHARRLKATVINLFIFLCNEKFSRKNFSLDSAKLTLMECDGT
jgi:hypothetical protein